MGDALGAQAECGAVHHRGRGLVHLTYTTAADQVGRPIASGALCSHPEQQAIYAESS